MNNLREYIEQLTGERAMRQVALRSGIEQSTLNRQVSGEMKVQTLIAICRAYNRPVVPSLVDVGVLTPEEAAQGGAMLSIVLASDRQLAEEILRRVVEAEEHPELSEPIGDDLVEDAVAKRRASRNVGGLSDTDDIALAPREQVEEALSRPIAAKRGKRKADTAPHAE